MRGRDWFKAPKDGPSTWAYNALTDAMVSAAKASGCAADDHYDDALRHIRTCRMALDEAEDVLRKAQEK